MIDEIKKALEKSKATNHVRYSNFKRMLKDYYIQFYNQIFKDE